MLKGFPYCSAHSRIFVREPLETLKENSGRMTANSEHWVENSRSFDFAGRIQRAVRSSG
jgi:hypothetical protein